MTDPISIATGVAGLVVSATRISIILHEYTYAFKDAPKDISDFSRELDGLSRILTRLQSMLPDAPLEASNTPQISQVENSENALMHFRPVGKIEETYDALAGVKSNGITKVESPFPDDYSQDLQKVLESCADVFTRIEELFKKFDIPTPASPNLRSGMAQFKNRIRWMVYSNDFAKLRAVVEAHKGTLNVTLLLLVK
ncbi:hypothetical protein BJ508DRAFT_122684 [Ascobolus immersus RN42]|uniref:Azaphilone pigments biosynthesis cluster protein L N-terminal domain-containing protein n=1 Tax=Ascobolus immersus RN42 TaxID=1160509 RepID=A0A3N4I457_ASCIM|nr:hypothetical protein BJ508DRAFT_122684 [Ascobolus immersus RN42]